MTYTTLISTDDLAKALSDSNGVVVDCRFALGDTERGRRDYQHRHIAGAFYAHMDDDLSSPPTPGKTGRHPLPDVDQLATRLSAWGIGSGTQVVAYDDSRGVMASRLWWLLRWLGHDAVAVLDGGWPKWVAEGRPSDDGKPTRTAQHFEPRVRSEWLVATEDVLRCCQGDSTYRVIDSRSAERYRGEVEPIDPVAGHIPCALNAPFVENLGDDGLFLSREGLRKRFQPMLGDVPIEQTVFYCGSGVSAAHNLLAVAHAGLGMARLYAGSWSEWIVDPTRPIATG